MVSIKNTSGFPGHFRIKIRSHKHTQIATRNVQQTHVHVFCGSLKQNKIYNLVPLYLSSLPGNCLDDRYDSEKKQI